MAPGLPPQTEVQKISLSWARAMAMAEARGRAREYGYIDFQTNIHKSNYLDFFKVFLRRSRVTFIWLRVMRVMWRRRGVGGAARRR